MSTRLSSLLVQASVVSVKQIERALERQVLRGGQLDTNLLEVGVGEDAILPHLAKSRDLEPAARSVWPTPSQQVLSMLSASTAQQSKLAPLGKEGGRFYVLTHESFSAAVLADVSAKLGLAVVPVIIPEFRVHEALSRYYGFPMPPRSAALVAKYPQQAPTEEEVTTDYPWATRSSTAWQRITSSAIIAVSPPAPNGEVDNKTVDLAHNFTNNVPISVDSDQIQVLLPPEPPATEDPTPSEPLLQAQDTHAEDQPTPVEAQIPAEVQSPIEAAPPETNYQTIESPAEAKQEATPEPNMHFDTPSEGTIPAVAQEDEHQDQKTPTENLRLPEVAIQEQAAPKEEPPVVEPPAVDPSKETTQAQVAAPPIHISLEELKAILEGDLSRDEILRQALAFIGQSTPEAFLFQVQPENNLLISREGVRRDQAVTSIPGINLPLAKTPILQRVVNTKNFLLDFPSEDYGLLEFFGLFDRRPPGSVFALPVVIKGRVVAVYLGVSDDIFTAQEVAQVPALGLVISSALLALIQRKKKGGESPSGEGPKQRFAAQPYDSDEMKTIPEIAAVKRPAATFAADEVLTQLRLKSAEPQEEETRPKLKTTSKAEDPSPASAVPIAEVSGWEQSQGDAQPVVPEAPQPAPTPEEDPFSPPTLAATEAFRESLLLQTQQATPVSEAPLEVIAAQKTEPVTEAPLDNSPLQTLKNGPITDAPIDDFALQTLKTGATAEGLLENLALVDGSAIQTQTEPIASPEAPTTQLSQTAVEDEVTLDPSDIQEEPSPPQVYEMQNLAAKLAQTPVQAEFLSKDASKDSPRSIPLVITHDLLRQTERLEKEHEALDLLAALIQHPKPKKAPDPAIEISRLIEAVDLGVHPNGNPIEHDGILGMVDQLVSYGDAALPAVFALFPGRRLPKTLGVLRLEEGNLLRLILRFGAKAVPGLKRLVSHPHQVTRFYAVWCLASLKDPDTLSAILPGMFDTDPTVRQVSLAGASQFARHPNFALVLSAVRQALSTVDERHRMFAAALVARFRMVELWPIVLDRLDDPSPEVAKESLSALMTLTFQDLGPKKKTWVSWFEKNSHLPREAWLIEALSHKELNIRQGAIQELKMLTGQTFDYRADAEKSERKQAIKHWEQWLQKGGG